jgi:hypothetical protein
MIVLFLMLVMGVGGGIAVAKYNPWLAQAEARKKDLDTAIDKDKWLMDIPGEQAQHAAEVAQVEIDAVNRQVLEQLEMERKAMLDRLQLEYLRRTYEQRLEAQQKEIEMGRMIQVLTTIIGLAAVGLVAPSMAFCLIMLGIRFKN